MDALVLWRKAALEKGPPEASSRAASPAPYSDTEDAALSGSEGRLERPALPRAPITADGYPVAPKPSSSSWIRWWSRRTADSTGARPDLRPMSSAPSNLVRPDHAPCNDHNLIEAYRRRKLCKGGRKMSLNMRLQCYRVGELRLCQNP
jgi:hypothetical protein